MSHKKQHQVKMRQKLRRKLRRRKLVKKGLKAEAYFRDGHYVGERKKTLA